MSSGCLRRKTFKTFLNLFFFPVSAIVFVLFRRIVPYETWLEQAQLTQLAADNEATTAQKFREALVLAREKSKMDYQSQYEATNFQLRKRIYETLRLKTELEWQRKNVRKFKKTWSFFSALKVYLMSLSICKKSLHLGLS